MKNYTAESIRNVGVFGHAGEGKTTLVETILYNAGLTDRVGKVEAGNTVSDFDPEEIKRGCSINMSVLPVELKDSKINFIDAPGGYDFYGDVASAIFLCDSALVVVGAVSGPVVGAEKAMAMCKANNKPRIMVINQMDRENANFEKVMDTVNEKFGPSVVPIQLPIMQGSNFVGFVDIVNSQAYKFGPKGLESIAIPSNLEGEVQELYEKLTEAAAETDEALMEKFFEEMELPKEDILYGLSKGVKEGTVTPVVCASALNNTGVKTLVENIVHYLPSAAEVTLPEATNADGEAVKLTMDGKMVAHVAKTINDQFGKYSIVKVLRGSLDLSVVPYNTTSEKLEKATAPVMIRGKKSQNIDKLSAGDIGAIPKLQFTGTNDTLCDQSDIVKIKPIDFPAPCIAMAISSKKQGEDDKVIAGLNRIHEEDPSITIEKNVETGDVLLCGLGEKHLDVVCGKLKNKSNVEASLSEQRIPYRETIRATAEAEGKHKKQTGGSGQFGVVNIRFEPADEGVDFEFVDAIVGGVVPREYIPAVEKGLREALVHGVLAGYPMIGVKATLFFGKYHPVDSKEVAFKSAARLAYKAACVKASPALIEPIYSYNIWVPNDNVGDIIGDLNRRRGRMLGMNPVDGGTEINAEAPLGEMTKYATDLLAMTQARGSFKSQFVRYEDVPSEKAKKIIESAKIEEEDED